MRPTIELEVGEHKFVVKSYASAREANAIQSVYFKGAKVEVVGETPRISEFDPGVQFLVHEELVRQMVVSIDGRAEGIVDACLDLPESEYSELIAKLDALTAKKKN